MLAVPPARGNIEAMIGLRDLRILTLPNALSAGRLAAVPLVVLAVHHGWNVAAFVLFLSAALTDAVDGHLARRFGWTSPFGAWLDALADKALMAFTLLALWFAGAVDWPLVAIVIGRDAGIIAVFLVLYMRGAPMDVRPLTISKVNTMVQFVLVAVLLGERAFSPVLQPVARGLTWVTLGLTAVSALAYLLVLAAHERKRPA